MSASEELRALSVRGDLPWTTKEQIDSIIPLIADVVEAVEALVAISPLQQIAHTEATYRQADALTALQEHLEGAP